MAEYIEREALISEIQEEIDFETTMYTEEQNKYFNMGLKCALRDVKRQPSADVVEVKHGEWKMRGGLFRCSVCDGKALLQDVGGTGGFSHEYEQVKSSYCPHCLAKMDGKESGNTTKIDK